MSLVTSDWQNPSSWLGARAAWGAVLDGTTLRVVRMSASGKTESFQEALETFRSGSELRKRIEKDRAKGSPVVVGIEPHRLMIRELTSPISDPRKADEIWLTLFDAAVPFPLEACRVALLLREPGEEGRQCLAVGVRRQDVEALREEWRARGLEPDLAVPEPLCASPDRKSRVWCGEQRTVWAMWKGRQFLGAGGAETPELREKTLIRQAAAHDLQTEHFDRVGPASDQESLWLEHRLAKTALKPDELTVNLLEGDLVSGGVRTRWERRVRQVRVLGVLAVALVWILPFLPAHLVKMQRLQQSQELGPAFEKIAGYPAPPGPPGYLLATARQVVNQEWVPLQDTLSRLHQAGPTVVLARGLDLAREMNLEVRKVDLGIATFSVEVQGRKEDVDRFASALQQEGWTVGVPTAKGDAWVLKGERS